MVAFGAYMMTVFTLIGSMWSSGSSRQPAAFVLLRCQPAYSSLGVNLPTSSAVICSK